MMNIILGSSSPRRREILAQMFPTAEVTSVPPANPEEKPFLGEMTWVEISAQLQEIARKKLEDVAAQSLPNSPDAILTADTAVVIPKEKNRFLVLGKPPLEQWQEMVRCWFRDYLSGKTHSVLTAVCLLDRHGQLTEQIVQTGVTFAPAAEEEIEWYIGTGESRGKAGGYGIQGAGSLFVESVSGSISNVIGLPMRETRALILEAMANQE